MPRNKYPEETVKKILDTSLQLFIKKGFEQTTVLDIVDNLGGLTRGAFYHHFKSKEEVLEAIFAMDFAERNPYEKVKQATVSNGRERLKLALKLGLKTNMEDEQRTAITGMAISLLANPRFLAEQIKRVQGEAEQMAAIMEEGMADGSLKKGNSRLISQLFLLLVSVWMMPTIFAYDKQEMLAKVEFCEQIFTALGYDFIDDELRRLFIDVLNQFGDTPK